MAYLVGTDPTAPHRRDLDRRATGGKISPWPRSFKVPAPAHAGAVEPLADILESAILPRLMTIHGVDPRCCERPAVSARPPAIDVAAVAPLAMDSDPHALLDHVDALLRHGVSVDSLFVDLLAPAARHLGVMWEDDRCDFVEVTMGLWRLQEVVREIAARMPPDRRPGHGSKRALFAAMPGDQHSFGTVLIEETFRRDGWDTDSLLDPATPELIERVARDWFDVVGLTVNCDCNIEPLPHLIHALRSVSRNPRIVAMVGGRVFMEDSTLAVAVGADGTAPDAVQALVVAGDLVHAVMCEDCALG